MFTMYDWKIYADLLVKADMVHLEGMLGKMLLTMTLEKCV